MTKYVEINGKRCDLDEEGHLFVEHDGGTFHFDPEEVRALGLGIREGAPKWAIVSPRKDGTVTSLTYGKFLVNARQDVPNSYDTGLELLVQYAKVYRAQTFELRKDGVVVATLKGENA